MADWNNGWYSCGNADTNYNNSYWPRHEAIHRISPKSLYPDAGCADDMVYRYIISIYPASTVGVG